MSRQSRDGKGDWDARRGETFPLSDPTGDPTGDRDREYHGQTVTGGCSCLREKENYTSCADSLSGGAVPVIKKVALAGCNQTCAPAGVWLPDQLPFCPPSSSLAYGAPCSHVVPEPDRPQQHITPRCPAADVCPPAARRGRAGWVLLSRAHLRGGLFSRTDWPRAGGCITCDPAPSVPSTEPRAHLTRCADPLPWDTGRGVQREG